MGLKSKTIMTEEEAASLLNAPVADLLTREESAALLKLAPRTLYAWEKEGRGPPAVRVGPRCVRYARRDLVAFLEASRIPLKAPSSALSRAELERIETAERTRALGILAQKGPDELTRKALGDGTSVEQFKAILSEAAATEILKTAAIVRGKKGCKHGNR